MPTSSATATASATLTAKAGHKVENEVEADCLCEFEGNVDDDASNRLSSGMIEGVGFVLFHNGPLCIERVDFGDSAEGVEQDREEQD